MAKSWIWKFHDGQKLDTSLFLPPLINKLVFSLCSGRAVLHWISLCSSRGVHHWISLCSSRAVLHWISLCSCRAVLHWISLCSSRAVVHYLSLCSSRAVFHWISLAFISSIASGESLLDSVTQGLISVPTAGEEDRIRHGGGPRPRRWGSRLRSRPLEAHEVHKYR